MASIERTAYPKFTNWIGENELHEYFTPSKEELTLAQSHTSTGLTQYWFMVLLKSFQFLGYFPSIKDIPSSILEYIKGKLGLKITIERRIGKSSIYNFHQVIRECQNVKVYDKREERNIAKSMAQMAKIRSDTIDLINLAVEELIARNCELPSYRRLHDLARAVHQRSHMALFSQICQKLTNSAKEQLDQLLELSENNQTLFQKVKEYPANPTLNHLKEWFNHLIWLDGLGEIDHALAGIGLSKLKAFAEHAKALNASEMKDIKTDSKRHSLFVCLIWHMRRSVRDQLVEMLIRRMRTIRSKAEEDLQNLLWDNRGLTGELIETLSDILDVFDEDDQTKLFTVEDIQKALNKHGGIVTLKENCATARAYFSRSHLPLMQKYFNSHRKTMYHIASNLVLLSTTEDNSLMLALNHVIAYQNSRKKYISNVIDLSFASDQWQRLIRVKQNNEIILSRKDLEICVFYYLSHHLQAGDIAVQGADVFADYREQLLSWDECQNLVGPYCDELGLPKTPSEFVSNLKNKLLEKSKSVDDSLKEIDDISIDNRGIVHLKRQRARVIPKQIDQLTSRLAAEMPERHLLDVLALVHSIVPFTRHFAPASGSDDKLKNHTLSYLVTTFAYGSNLGPNQCSRHLGRYISAQMLSYINHRHVSLEKLDRALADVINVYRQFSLPKIWGDEYRAGTDGTHIPTYDRNLWASYHFRYKASGGVAYHHVSDTYIALFTRFIQCGMWEAIYILDGLIQNQSQIKPLIVHGDTQAGSTTVFGLSYLLGINVMPRIRNWGDLTFYKADKSVSYKHMKSVFTDEINWKLIETHWKDIMQVVLSVNQGKIDPSTILRKLSYNSRKNKLYKAFQELGRVIRTLFLLDYISNPQLRQSITATTNKVEAFHNFSEFFRFGGLGILQTNDPEEQEKRLKYGTLIANVVMLQNVIDMTNIINQAVADGYIITENDLTYLSPYWTQSIKRFGQYLVELILEPPKYQMELKLAG